MKNFFFKCLLTGSLLVSLGAFCGCTKNEGKTPTNEPVKTITVNGVEFKMILVEGGTFKIGSTPEQEEYNRTERAKPVHDVTLSSFYIGETEVTNELWKAIMGEMPEKQNSNDPQLPVSRAEYRQIIKNFIPKLKEITGLEFTIPTEAQWEFAARGGNKTQGYIFSGSNDPDEVASYMNNGDKLRTVKSFKPNELGLYDMSGNVIEMCRSYLGDYTEEHQIDPELPESEDIYTFRGGQYSGFEENIVVSERGFAQDLNYFGGFRLSIVIKK